ncbi:MAG TPA: hypothetical protein VF103_01635 [Polyangiaceae bacterium]
MSLRKTLPLIAIAAASSGCGHPVKRQLEGRWFGESVENFEQRELPAVTGWARGVSFEFAGENVTVSVPAEEPRTAPYQVASVQRNDVRLAIQRPTGQKESMLLRLDDERNIRWMLDEHHAVVLRREE